MARLQLNKSSLARESKSLLSFERFLPSLNLKRQQLMIERAVAKKTLKSTRKKIEVLNFDVGNQLPMLANEDIELTNLVTISNVITKKENLVGIYLPCFIRIDVNIQDYALLAKPHWVDKTVILLKEILELNVREKIEEERVKLLSSAVKTITQRVNLFDKVLIPKTKVNIRRIKIYLSDEQMTSVVRSKIAKRMHAKDVS